MWQKCFMLLRHGCSLSRLKNFGSRSSSRAWPLLHSYSRWQTNEIRVWSISGMILKGKDRSTRRTPFAFGNTQPTWIKSRRKIKRRGNRAKITTKNSFSRQVNSVLGLPRHLSVRIYMQFFFPPSSHVSKSCASPRCNKRSLSDLCTSFQFYSPLNV
jgi:hypothetical protein